MKRTATPAPKPKAIVKRLPRVKPWATPAKPNRTLTSGEKRSIAKGFTP